MTSVLTVLLLGAGPLMAQMVNLQAQPLEESVTPADPTPKPAKKSKKTAKKNSAKKEAKTSAPEEPPPEIFHPPVQSNDAAEILYPDQLGEQVSEAVVGLANRLDSFFGEERADDEKNGSTLRIIPSHTFYDHRKEVRELGINVNLKLRNLEKKARKLEAAVKEELLQTAETLTGKDSSAPGSEGKPPENKVKKYNDEEEWHYNFESRLAARPAIYYSGKVRVRRNYQQEFFLHHFSISAGWDTDDRWTQKYSLNSDHALNEILLLRVVNDANWYMTRKSFQTVHGPSLIQTINAYNSISYNFRLTFTNEGSDFHHIETAYSINYRHGTPSKRIFIDVIPAYTYPRFDHYRENKSLELKLEYFFGDLN
jgi:hypothetical protein